MLHLYFSNDLNCHKNKLIDLLRTPCAGVFESERILVQSQGMAQWLKLSIAQAQGIAANISFPLPASFIWNQYHRALDGVPEQNAFTRDAMLWHLMDVLNEQLNHPALTQLRAYLGDDDNDEKRYGLCSMLASLFDQYLVYRMDWIAHWQAGRDSAVSEQIRTHLQSQGAESEALLSEIESAVRAQGVLWRALYERIQAGNEGVAWHRAALHQHYLDALAHGKVKYFPPRLFVFGIAALPASFWQMLQAIGEHCDVHVFYTNPCQHFWGDIMDEAHLKRMQLRGKLSPKAAALARVAEVGHPLLASWGKMGRDFFNLLSEHPNSDELGYREHNPHTLLGQIQNAILNLDDKPALTLDRSITIKACHSPMREMEVLQQQLLHYFEQDPALTPKDIVVMLPDVERYVPYIHAVFARYDSSDPRYIPYAIADRTLSQSDQIVATLLTLLTINESLFSAEEVLALLDVAALRERFAISESELSTLRQWVASCDIRYGLDDSATSTVSHTERNWNAWQAGLKRMLLGATMREDDGAWQAIMPFGLSYGLSAQLSGKLAEFLDTLSDWQVRLSVSLMLHDWQAQLQALVAAFFVENSQTQPTLQWIFKQLDVIFSQLPASPQRVSANVMVQFLQGKLDEQDLAFNFLTGKLNFCTLLPMRAIPFKVVALLGMNENDYPRTSTPMSFDLMQYAARAGDRVRREDDRYLFLEALLSAEQTLYISYVGRTLDKHEPRQPSVLVSQLLDYITQHADTPAQQLVSEQPMAVFSPRNFQGEDRSFAREWLFNGESAVAPFIQPMAHGVEQHSEPLAFARLLEFVTDPVAYFFRRQLGVYWQNSPQHLRDCENFELDSLSQYNLRERLLAKPPAQWSHTLEQARLQGRLPRAHFGTLEGQAQTQQLHHLAQAIAPYLAETPSQLPFRLQIAGWQLEGTLAPLYHGQFVHWRAGKLRSKDYIAVWLQHLMLCAQRAISQPSQFFALHAQDSQNIAQISFAPLEPAQAMDELTRYVTAFEHALQRILPLPNEALLAQWLRVKNLPPPLTMMNEAFETQADNPYWARLLTQQTFSDEEKTALYTTAQAWFALMLRNLGKSAV
ncbi:exodeoxyribonuclease V subunit gamma [Pasteurellaceae bacterium HPA106]|uniref:exodeoxyribonuclease V subunit gamma n=1 Tax=Spirabiliibacterium pneumoniae TaxID=221400 RepID=UPI001AADEF12|nr:exodeoxyribonuclease V subunit gamma [Spirabiliibacterium pneumoniae]MBE2896298.1 exodeoxyribonuclease V subunit gamma [Spirabiliibacterium pneumoniae]